MPMGTPFLLLVARLFALFFVIRLYPNITYTIVCFNPAFFQILVKPSFFAGKFAALEAEVNAHTSGAVSHFALLVNLAFLVAASRAGTSR